MQFQFFGGWKSNKPLYWKDAGETSQNGDWQPPAKSCAAAPHQFGWESPKSLPTHIALSTK